MRKGIPAVDHRGSCRRAVELIPLEELEVAVDEAPSTPQQYAKTRPLQGPSRLPAVVPVHSSKEELAGGLLKGVRYRSVEDQLALCGLVSPQKG